MAPKTPKTTTQISKVELPAWVDAASQANYQQATDLAQQPYQPYTGDRVADLSAQEQAAGGTLANGMGVTNSALQMALGAAGNAGGYQPTNVTAPGAPANVTAQSFLQGDIGAYMDPNINNVVNTTLQGMDRGIAQGQNSIADQSRGVGAFGGSRHGVQSAVFGAEGERAKAGTEANLRSAAFQDAAGRMQSDNATALQAAMANQQAGLAAGGQNLQAQMANQNAGLAGAGLGLQAGQLATQVGQTASDTSGRNALLQSQLGAQERALEQAKLDTNYAGFLEKRDHPTEMLNMQLAALGMSPYGKTTDTKTTQPQNSGSGLLTGLGAVATILPLLFGSDRKLKKNVKRIGKVEGTDLNKYEFDYKNENGFMGRGKQVGLMAQDVEKKIPNSGAVQTVKQNGKTFKAVNYELAILKARDARNDKGKARAPYRPRGTRIGIGSRAA